MNYKFLQISTLIIGILSPAIASAQSAYKPLVPIPGITDRVGDFGQFFSSLFGLAISIIAILAVVMIAWGGIKYMTTDAIQGKEEGKDRIRDALLGLLLALAAYLILYYINPNLLKIKFTPARLEVRTQGFEVASTTSGNASLPSGVQIKVARDNSNNPISIDPQAYVAASTEEKERMKKALEEKCIQKNEETLPPVGDTWIDRLLWNHTRELRSVGRTAYKIDGLNCVEY